MDVNKKFSDREGRCTKFTTLRYSQSSGTKTANWTGSVSLALKEMLELVFVNFLKSQKFNSFFILISVLSRQGNCTVNETF